MSIKKPNYADLQQSKCQNLFDKSTRQTQLGALRECKAFVDDTFGGFIIGNHLSGILGKKRGKCWGMCHGIISFAVRKYLMPSTGLQLNR
ncbi:MAG: hypothetical protein NTX45_02395 [Proteobacteria bacterium]|nr:hypothetical protein [Pseudomonadota bacterium]